MFRIFIVMCFILFFFGGFSLFQRTEKEWALPPDFAQKPIRFSTDKPDKIEGQLQLLTEKYSSKAVEWWVLYKKALLHKKKNLELFCENMWFLSQIRSFPLKDYVRLYLYSHCEEKSVEMDIYDFPEWMRKKAVKAWYNKAQKQNHEEELLLASYQMYLFSKENYLKNKYLLKAIAIAKKKQKKNLLKKWRKQLYELSPRYIPQPSHSQKLKVANDFRKSRQFKKASFYYKQLLNHPHTSFYDKNQAFKWMRWIYKMQKNRAGYLRATKQWKSWLKRQIKKDKKAAKAYHDILYILARTQWTLHKNTQALKTLNQIEATLKKSFSLFQVYRMKALIFKEQKQLKKSLIFFKKALESEHNNKELIDKTQWEYAWTLKKMKKHKESIQELSKLLQMTKSEYLPSRVRFWIGRQYEDLGEKKTAHQIYSELISKDPLSYYGLLAHYKLNKKIQVDQPKSFSKKQIKTEYTIVQWLLSLNEYESALEFLKYKSKLYEEDSHKKTKKWLNLFYYMAHAQSYFPLFKLVGSLPLEERTIFFQTETELLFPMIYKEEVEKASRMFNLEKEIIYALIRQESAWNPKARSPADAFGLMQIRPFVAKKTAKQYGIAYKNMYNLYNPAKNILIGSAFLKQLFQKYNFQFIITTAVYNAGRSAVMSWLKKSTNQEEDPLSFIEEIPYQETRTYVRLLIRNFVFYKILNHPERAVFFPKWILQMDSNNNNKVSLLKLKKSMLLQ